MSSFLCTEKEPKRLNIDKLKKKAMGEGLSKKQQLDLLTELEARPMRVSIQLQSVPRRDVYTIYSFPPVDYKYDICIETDDGKVYTFTGMSLNE